MSTIALSGKEKNAVYTLKTKSDGTVRAEINNKKKTFSTWTSAESWVNDEIKRSYKK